MGALDTIRKPIEAEMTRFCNEFDARFSHRNPLLNQVLKGVAMRKGKMMRPLLTLLAAKLFAEPNDATFHTALTFEFFHNASLLHDDVVDESDKRRGEESVNVAFNNQVAVLVGDYILATALQEASLTECPRLIYILSVASQDLANGELLQLNNIRNYEFSEEVYYDIIRNKTAALFSGCAEGGAMSVTDNADDIQTLKNFGEIVGLCFQIRDDIFDYNDDKSIGKPTGNDMKEGKLTLPVIYALNSTQDAEMQVIARKVKDRNVTEEEVARLVDFTKKNGGIVYAEKKMEELGEKAKSLLNKYEDSDVKQALVTYVDFVIGRSL